MNKKTKCPMCKFTWFDQDHREAMKKVKKMEQCLADAEEEINILKQDNKDLNTVCGSMAMQITESGHRLADAEKCLGEMASLIRRLHAQGPSLFDTIGMEGAWRRDMADLIHRYEELTKGE